MDRSIVAGRETYVIPRDWDERWEFLQDLELEGSMQWTYSSPSSFSAWVAMNLAMDSGESTTLVELSTVLPIIDFMRPSPLVEKSYLLYTHIDRALPQQKRKSYYEQLGKIVRGGSVRYPYAGDSSLVREQNNVPDYDYTESRYRLHDNLRLRRDPIYHHQLDEEYDTLLNDETYNVLTGIIHSAFQRTRLPSFVPEPEDAYYDEVPWYLIEWQDMSLLRRNFPTYLRAMEDTYNRYSGSKLLSTVRFIRSTYISDGIGDVVGVFSGDDSVALHGWDAETRLPIVETVAGSYRVPIPRFESFLPLYNKIQRRRGESVASLLWNPPKTQHDIVWYGNLEEVRTISESVTALLVNLLAQSGDDMVLFSISLADTLGTEYLQAYVELNLTHFEHATANERWAEEEYNAYVRYMSLIESFCEEGLRLIDERGLTSFQRWPIYKKKTQAHIPTHIPDGAP